MRFEPLDWSEVSYLTCFGIGGYLALALGSPFILWFGLTVN